MDDTHRRPRIRRALWASAAAAVLTLATALTAAAPATALTGSNVLFHDPSVIKADGCYYGFSTGFENDSDDPSGAITIHRTCDATPATGWSKIGNVWSSTPAWITTALGSTPPNIWAPDVDYFNGVYHLYYAASKWGTSTAVMGLMTASTPAGPWTDQGMVTNVNYPIDPDVVRGGDGRLYIAWGSFTGGGVYMHVLDETTGKLSTTDNNLWKIATGMEGASIVADGGYYYLFGSAGNCCQGTNSTYFTKVGRATSVTGPYYDQAGNALTSGAGTRVLSGAWPRVAAGGGDAYTDGSSTFLAYHYYDANNNGQATLDIRQLTFSGGWPILDSPLGKTNLVLQVQHDSRCLDVWGLSTADGAAVDQGNCNGGTNQQWQLQASGSSYQIVNVNSGKCLQPSGSAVAGAVMVQQTCGTGATQLWTISPTIGAYRSIVNTSSNLCLEVYGNSTTNGAATNLWSCNGGANQTWLVD
ncbi:RICIN domain-containing protein [Microbacterium sp. X-17]|uniref:RICIN domain-containing protein n=1 Tax=Microbacterium sp. X-17 TaxID=3144404 RepID=UPI0031F5A5AF